MVYRTLYLSVCIHLPPLQLPPFLISAMKQQNFHVSLFYVLRMAIFMCGGRGKNSLMRFHSIKNYFTERKERDVMNVMMIKPSEWKFGFKFFLLNYLKNVRKVLNP